MRMLDWLVDGYGVDADATWIVDHHEVWIIPSLNPDGHWIVELGTQPPYNGNPFYQRKTPTAATGATRGRRPHLHSTGSISTAITALNGIQAAAVVHHVTKLIEARQPHPKTK